VTVYVLIFIFDKVERQVHIGHDGMRTGALCDLLLFLLFLLLLKTLFLISDPIQKITVS